MRARRPIANPNPGYKEQLEIYSQCNCDPIECDAPFAQWKKKRNEAMELSPAAFSGGVAGIMERGRKVKRAQRNLNMDLITDGLWLGE